MRQPIPPTPGSTEVLQFLNVLTNPEEYAKKLAYLEDIRREINDQIRKMSIKGDIDQMLASTKVKNERAQKALEDATEKSEQMMAHAREQSEKVLDEANAELEKIQRRVVQSRSELESRELDLRSREERLQLENEKLEQQQALASDELRKAKAIREEYETKVQRLNVALAGARGE